MLPHFKTYYEMTVEKPKQMDQWSRVENRDVNPPIYDSLCGKHSEATDGN